VLRNVLAVALANKLNACCPSHPSRLNSCVQTPNIDRLAREGLRLTSFYAQPICGMPCCKATARGNHEIGWDDS
jgi:arylsulfatase A-like enzyme